ncbi:MAG TPA: hypothetical protein PLV92_24825, partial [Pirellulaceae bacterium]|nr:hypothetical protein [Pirellulaceae bacterium]
MTTTPAQPTPRKQPPPDLLTILECAFRHKWLALAAGCVMAALGFTAGQLGIPAQYKATAMVRLSGPNGVVERPHESSNAQREFRSTQQELIKMQHVLLRALEMPQVRELDLLDVDTDSADDLASWITLDLPRSSEILRISVRHGRADAAYILANAVTEAYLQELRRDSEEDLEKRITVLDKLHATVEERLAKSWAELQV